MTTGSSGVGAEAMVQNAMGWQIVRHVKAVLLALALVVFAVLAVIRFAPIYLPALPTTAPPVEERTHLVFGYATLANPVVRFVVVGRPSPSRPAALDGFRRAGRDLEVYPAASVDGRVFSVDGAGLQRLDRYEQTGLRYGRRLKRLTDGTEAWVYRLVE